MKRLNFWPLNRHRSTKKLEEKIEAATAEATVEHEKVIKSLQKARGDAEKLKKVIKRNGFTIQIAKAMVGQE